MAKRNAGTVMATAAMSERRDIVTREGPSSYLSISHQSYTMAALRLEQFRQL
jgi:hypothetical protein